MKKAVFMKSEILRYFCIIFAVVTLLLLSSWKKTDSDPITRWDAAKDQLLAEASEKTVEELIYQLDSKDATERIVALMALEEMEPSEVVPLLYGFDDLFSLPVIEANQHLAKAWGTQALPVIMDILENSSLVRDMDDSSEWVHGYLAIDALATIGPDAVEAVPILLKKLDEPYTSTILDQGICNALESIGVSSDEVINAFLRILDDENSSSRHGDACFALGALANPGDQDIIARLLEVVDQYESSSNRANWDIVLPARCALYKLGWEQDENFGIIIEKAYEDNGFFVLSKEYAWESLIRIGNEWALEALGNIILELKDTNLGSAYSELGNMGSKPYVLELLILALDRPGYPIDLSSILQSDSEIPHILFINDNVKAAYQLGRFGATAVDALPRMLEIYRELSENIENIDDEYEIYLNFKNFEFSELEEAIIRIHEGL